MKETITILIVDDDELNRRSIGRILKRAGYAIIEAADGTVGARLFEEHTEIRLVLSDTDMPNMDGEQMYRLIVNELDQRRIPFIVMSGRPQRQGLRHLQFLSKPFGRQTLLDLISSAFCSS